MNINQIYHHRAVSTERNDNLPNWLLSATKKRLLESSKSSKSREVPKKNNINQCTSSKNDRNSKKRQQTYAINLCLCEKEKHENALVLLPTTLINEPNIVKEENSIPAIDPEKVASSFESKNTLPFEISNFVDNPIEIYQRNINKPFQVSCSGRDCKCLNKMPSCTSINKLLDIFRHEEFKTSEFVNNESLKNLISDYDHTVKLQKDIFTSTIDEVKSMRPESKLIETINPDNDSFIKYPSISLHINSFEDEGGKNEVNCKEVDDSLCYEGDHGKHTINEKSVQSKTKENITVAKITNDQQECQIPERSHKCTNAESLFCNTHTSVQSFISRHYQNSINLKSKSNQMTKSSESSFYSICPVEFLGVTLSNNESNNVSTSTYSKNQLLKKGTSHHVVSSTYCQYTELDITKQSPNGKQYENLSQNNDVILSQKLNCICCNKVEECDDLELNTFELLTEYLQKKLEDFKLTSYKTSNMLPYEEDVLYNDIINKVKKLILDMNDETLCKCLKDNQSDNIDASWKRASSLLQEYLRNKIKRITCSCTVTIKNSNSVLPGILDKVCQLIEDDFRKLRRTYVDRNTLNTGKYNLQESTNQNNKNLLINEMLTKDIGNENSQVLISFCNAPNSVNTIKSNEIASSVLTETEQLKTKAIKSTELTELGIKSGQDKTGKENSFYCDCTEVKSVCKNLTSQLTSTFSLQNILDEKVFLSISPEKKEKINTEEDRHSLSIPYIGYTLDCTCDKMLGPCVCAKSVLASKKNIYKDNIWKAKENVNTSYIMQGASGENSNTNPIEILDYNSHDLVRKNSCVCEKVIDANRNNEGIKLKMSTQNLEQGINNSTNTSRTFDDVEYSSYNEWDDCESYYSQNVTEASTHKDKLYDSLHLPIDYLSNRGKSKTLLHSDDVLMPSDRSDNCDCELVPICHVKMLIDNIERKLESCKCTCDSLCPNVCPIHYETVSF